MESNASIMDKIESSILLLLKNDLFLLETNADEWAICHKLAEYLQNHFMDWHVDVEYNRDKEDVKTRGEEKIRPDIIVHIRNTSNNLLAIETKKSNNLRLLDDDADRVKWLTSPEGKFKYFLGALIVFYVGEEHKQHPNITYFQDGKVL